MKDWEFIEFEGVKMWVPKKPKTISPAPEKPEPKRSREHTASILGSLGIAVDTSIATASDIAAERQRKETEHEQLLEDHEQQRQAREQLAAKSDSESMLAIGPTGRVDTEFTAMLKQVLATNTVTNQIDWVATKAERNKCLDAYEHAKQHGLIYKIKTGG
jgi:hypothetical protein